MELMHGKMEIGWLILGAMIGVIGIIIFIFPILELLEGALLSLSVISRVLLGMALLALSIGLMFKKYININFIIFSSLMFLGILLMSLSPENTGYLKIVLYIGCMIFALVLALSLYVFLKKLKSTKRIIF
jgi:hypothetical protein